MQEVNSNWRTLTTSLPSLIKIFLAKKRDIPLVVNASIIAAGISNSIDLFCSTKIFLIAGSNSHAIDAVPPATPKDKKSAIIILNKCFFM